MKKITIIILAFLTTSLSQAQDWIFDNSITNTLDAADMDNWIDANTFSTHPTTSEFYKSGNKFDVYGQTIDLGGLTIGEVTFGSYLIGGGGVTNSGNITINSKNPPSFASISVQFNTAGTVIYNFSGTSINDTQALYEGPHYNINFQNTHKKTGVTFSFAGNLTMSSNIKLAISHNTNFTILGSATLTGVGSNNEFIVNCDKVVVGGFNFTDLRATRTHPGTWRYKTGYSGAATNFNRIHPGTFENLVISTPLKRFITATGTSASPVSTTVTGSLDLTETKDYNGSSGTSALVLYIAEYSTLIISGTLNNSSSSIKLAGSNRSNLTIEKTATLYFDQTNDLNRTLKNLTIGGNSISVTLGNWLNISGGTSTSGFGVVDVIAGSNNLYTQGYLTLKSNAFGTAMTSSSPGSIKYSSGNNTGTLLVENYIPYQKSGGSSKGRQYRFLSSPVLNGTFYQWRDSILDNHISNTSGTPNNNKGIQITGASPNSPTGNFDESTTNNPSLFTYNENNAGSSTGIGNSSSNEDAGWTAATDGLGSITNGIGYRVLVRGDRKISLKSTSNVTPNNTTIQTRGGYVTGRVDVTITNSGTNTNNGINLVGNPYSSAIDWETVHTASSNLDAAYVIWDVENLSYQSYTKGGSGAASRYISPGQGFLVYCTATGGSKSSPASGYIRFEDNAKTTINGNGGRFFQEVKTNHLITILRQDSTAADKTFIYFKSGATNYYDQFDAGHIQNNNANLASIDSSNTYYNVNCMDSLTNQRIIPLTLFGSPIGKYSMSFQDVNTFRNHDIFLIDNFTKKTTKIDDMTEIDITINSDLNSYKDGRLFLSFEPKNTTTVVTLKKSNAYKIGPNPVENNLIVSYNNKEFSNTTYEIVNINGQILNTGTVEKDNNSIFTGYLERGIYFITLRNNIETQTIKFIK